jgi:hypothetical protein
MDKRTVAVIAPNQSVVELPRDAVRVADELHGRGINLTAISSGRIVHEAVRIILGDAPPEAGCWKPHSCVISFRIPEDAASALDAVVLQRNIVGIRSRSQFIRRLTFDFNAGRLAYADAHAPIVDWDKLKIRTRGMGHRKEPRKQSAPEGAAPINGPTASPLTDADLTGDIERLIVKVVTPYVDLSNPLMDLEELQAECRAKLARIIDSGRLAQCPTRAKVFAYLKTSFRNHVRSLITKHAFAAKRTGVKPSERGPVGENNVQPPSKVQVVRLDDPEVCHQVGNEDERLHQSQFLEDLFENLPPSDCEKLHSLIACKQASKEETVVDDALVKADRKERRRLLRDCLAILHQ